MNRFAIGLVLCLSTVHAMAGEDPLAYLKKDQPKDVAALIERVVGCNHWAGEEPFDAGRRKEISSALADLRCDQLSADETKTIKKYAGNAKVLKGVKEAKETSW